MHNNLFYHRAVADGPATDGGSPRNTPAPLKRVTSHYDTECLTEAKAVANTFNGFDYPRDSTCISPTIAGDEVKAYVYVLRGQTKAGL